MGEFEEDVSNVTSLPVRGRRSLRSIKAASFLSSPAPVREWLVRDLVPTRAVTLLGGAGAVGKSLVALQLAMAVAAGDSWLGLPIAAGRSLYLSAEDEEAEMHRRTRAIARSMALPSNSPLGNNLSIVPLVGVDTLLATPNGPAGLKLTPLFAELEELIVEEQPTFVVVDTLGRTFGGDENQRNHAQQFIGALQGLCIKHDLTIMVLAHPSLSGLHSGSGTSGSTAWEAAVRSRLYMERPKGPDGDARTLTTKKANYAKQGSLLTIAWRRGVFAVVETEAEPPKVAADKQADDAADALLLRLVAAAAARDDVLSDRPGRNYAPAVLARTGEGAGVGRKTLSNAMKRLLDGGQIMAAEIGPKSKKRRRLVVCEGVQV